MWVCIRICVVMHLCVGWGHAKCTHCPCVACRAVAVVWVANLPQNPHPPTVLGLHEDDAEAVFRKVKRQYEGDGPASMGVTGATGEDGEDLGQSLIVRRYVGVFGGGMPWIRFICGGVAD